MNVTVSSVASRASGLYSWLAGRYSAATATASSQRSVLLIALIAAGAIAIVLIAAIAFLPAKRKVVRKRRVRRIRRKVQECPESASDSERAKTPPVSRSQGRIGLAVSTGVWALLVVVSFAVAYAVTGSNAYCGQSCHAADSHVAAAIKTPHADCVDCHEADPVSGAIARVRMAVAQTYSKGILTAMPVDPDRCLRCHGGIAQNTVKTKAGLIVSHKEILAGGRTCSDCHQNVGHGKTASVVGGMSRCTSCHDGVAAKRTCGTCHVSGSPISVAGAAKKASSAFDYGPAVRVASTDCSRCHGEEKECRACHNGFVLPHPKEFIEGGHARTAAFGGKTKCLKCHTLVWCGSDKCHHSFSAHSQTAWAVGHQTGTSEKCGSCHVSWDPAKGSFCKVCH